MVEFLTSGRSVMDRETVEEIKRHFDKTAGNLYGHVDKTVGELRGHVDKTVGGLHAHFDETVEDMKRQVGIFAEGIRSDMRVIAEGQDILSEKVARVETRLGSLEGEVQRVHTELSGQLKDHDRRLASLERKSTGHGVEE
jgi:hypothetical protein